MTKHPYGAACVGALIATCLGATLGAIYIPVEVEEVPVDRIVANLEAIAKQNPADTRVRFNLARAHAIAYAQKATTLPVARGRVSDGPWFGYGAAADPFDRVLTTRDPALQKASAGHLNRAIQRYREVIAQEPSHPYARLGLAWCLEQAGNRSAAIEGYRTLIADSDKASPVPVQRDAAGRPLPQPPSPSLGDSTVAVEAAGYLIPLLDPAKDAAELWALRERQKKFQQERRPVTPIVIPLRDELDPSALVNRSARVAFDVDGSRLPKHWTWIAPSSGWLVFAPNPEKPITSGLQLFGSVTFWLFWENGYQALASLDDNQDGALAGAELRDLAIWQDLDEDGVSEQGEVKSLAAWQIVALSTAHVATPSDPDLAAFSTHGVTLTDGRVRPTFDVILREQVNHARPLTQ